MMDCHRSCLFSITLISWVWAADSLASSARFGGCTLDIECDDGLPCTLDECDFPVSGPVGSGACVHTTIADGQPGGIEGCPQELGLLCGGCDDGLFCNGAETCLGGVCAAGSPPCSGGQVCSESFDLCQEQACSTAIDCSNPAIVGASLAAIAGLRCNGIESCISGVCVRGQEPCGIGTTCAEKRCSVPGNPNLPHSQTIPCFSDEDCAIHVGSTCTATGPVCALGRCCTGTGEPVCTRRYKAQGRCLGGGNSNAMCNSAIECATGNCNLAQSCDSIGGKFYPSEPAIYSIPPGAGLNCPVINDEQVRCPKYGGGIAPHGPEVQPVGPVSGSPHPSAIAGSPVNRLGDDYTFSNTGVCVGGSRAGLGCADNSACTGGGVCNLAGPSVMSVYYLRFLGTIIHSTSLSIEFRDAAGRFVDRRWVPAAGSGIVVLYFDPPVIVPSSGFVVLSVDSDKTPDGAFFWSSTDSVDIGTNDPNILWLNDAPVANFLTPNPGVLAFELEGEKVQAPLGACCDSTSVTCTDGVLPWVCTGDGNTFQGTASCPAPACDEGACCNSAIGECTVGSESDCTNTGGEFQGFGTDCDADHGYDAGAQHCCEQPVMSGADRCGDALVHDIEVPESGEPPVVVTISGDNSPATFQTEDFCCPPNVECPLDLGWWEAFEIDKQAYVRIDYCCSDPLQRLARRDLHDSCPCGASIYPSPNPFRYPEAEIGNASPYCADDNRWMNYGPLPAGRYYIPVRSTPAGPHGPYQLHITVDALPTAACCVADQCTDGINQIECDHLGGTFLAPPQKLPAVADCSGDPCATGSCCPEPGVCLDTALGQPITKDDCDSLNGSYHGGVRCQGGTCDSDPVVSCRVDSDCPNTDCNVLPQQQAQPSPCPTCDVESADSCQPFENVVEFGISDRGLDMLMADDFTPLGTSLTNVCVWGFYLDYDWDSPSDCSAAVSQDHFRVRVFANDPVTQRVPGVLIGETMAAAQRVTLAQPTIIETLLDTEVYAFQLALNAPIAVSPSATYWLEVSNDASIGGPPRCTWFWSQTQQRAESYSFAGSGGTYLPSHAMPADQVFCTNFDLQASTMGLRPGACCRCDESCSAKSLRDCLNDDGIWDISEESCAGVNCPAGPPVNDNCMDGPTLITDGSYTFHNQCATTDGFFDCGWEWGSPIYFDLWYRYVAPSECVVNISMCQTGVLFDTALAVYHNPSAPTVCSECPLNAHTSEATQAGMCQDESCTREAVGGAGYWNSLDQILRPAMPGECFLIRVGSFPGSRGTGILDVSCEPYCEPPMGPACEPMPFSAARFIGIGCGLFHPCANPTPVVGAIRVRLTSLHQVNPPYTGGPTIPFTSFEGQTRWVGPPQQYVESSSQPIPFWVSHLQCTPHYQDWSGYPAVYVSGTEIVPSSTYEYEMLYASCSGIEDTCLDVSATYVAATTRWGDVWTPFNPPDASVQPDVADISALVNKFRNAPGAPSKAQALLAGAPGNSFGQITHEVLNVDFGFSHISMCVDAFRGIPYPYAPASCP